MCAIRIIFTDTQIVFYEISAGSVHTTLAHLTSGAAICRTGWEALEEGILKWQGFDLKTWEKDILGIRADVPKQLRELYMRYRETFSTELHEGRKPILERLDLGIPQTIRIFSPLIVKSVPNEFKLTIELLSVSNRQFTKFQMAWLVPHYLRSCVVRPNDVSSGK